MALSLDPMAKRRNNAKRLRNSIGAMPNATKQAMLRGIRSNRVIVGAYVDKRGGVCRCSRLTATAAAPASAPSPAPGTRSPAPTPQARRASRLEVRILENYLEMALVREGIGGETLPERPLAEEVRDVKATRRRLAAAEAEEAIRGLGRGRPHHRVRGARPHRGEPAGACHARLHRGLVRRARARRGTAPARAPLTAAATLRP